MATSELSAIGTTVARCPSFELAGAAFQRFDQAAVHWRDTEDASKSSPHAIHLRAPVGQGCHRRGFALRRAPWIRDSLLSRLSLAHAQQTH
jgi:hypothetical protein